LGRATDLYGEGVESETIPILVIHF
jgi:hypothetical protein